MTRTKSSSIWILAAVLSVGSALAAAILYCFDPNQCSFYPACLFHRATGLLCPGCGSLRALHQLLHGHLVAAFEFNQLLVLALVFGGGFAIAAVIRTAQGKPVRVVRSTKWLWLGLALALAFSVWRNLPGSLFATLPQ